MQPLLRDPPIFLLLMCCVGIWELYLSVWQTSTASWNKAAPAKTAPITINLSRRGEEEGDTHSHTHTQSKGAPSLRVTTLKTTHKSLREGGLLNLTSHHGFATCI